MVAAKSIRFIGGLVTTPMEAGPGDFASCVNLFDENGMLLKRSGMRILGSYGDWINTGYYTGWGDGTAEPSSVGTGIMNPSATSTTLYFGGNKKFYQFHVYGRTLLDSELGWATNLLEYKRINSAGMVAEYWDGSSWVPIAVADLFIPFYDKANNSFGLAPYCAYRADGSGSSLADGFQVRGRIKPPSNWAPKSIGGQIKYWFRIRGMLNKQQTSARSVASSSRFTNSENPLLCVLPFQDRNGTPHLFVVFLASSARLVYVLDGATLTASESLEPYSGGMFSVNTRVWAYYDAATDRVIGYVEGHTWFYTVSANNGEIYNLAADDVGTATPYQSVIGGLRSAIPPGTIATTYDDRIFTANGQTVVYSSPGVYKDIWPNDNELIIGDDRGNITAMVAVGGVLAIFKRDSIWVAQSDGSDDGYTAYRLPGNVGCIAPRSLAVAGNVAYFLGEDGVYSFDGNATQKLSRRIDGYFSRGWSSAPERAIGVWHPVMNQYRLFHSGPQCDPWVCDSALYVTITQEGARFWPQGPYNKTVDEGFSATCVVRDDSRSVPRILLGDRYGNLWVMDTGYFDGTGRVSCDGVTHRMNLGTSQKYLMRWVTPITPTDSSNKWTLKAWGDGQSDDKQSVSPYLCGDADMRGFHGATGMEDFTGSQTFAVDVERASGPPQSFEVLGRYLQLQFTDTNVGPWGLDAIEVEATPFARMG